MPDLPDYLTKAIRRYAAEQVKEKCGLAADGKKFCEHHRVHWDAQQHESDDECQECGRTRPQHRNQMVPE